MKKHQINYCNRWKTLRSAISSVQIRLTTPTQCALNFSYITEHLGRQVQGITEIIRTQTDGPHTGLFILYFRKELSNWRTYTGVTYGSQSILQTLNLLISVQGRWVSCSTFHRGEKRQRLAGWFQSRGASTDSTDSSASCRYSAPLKNIRSQVTWQRSQWVSGIARNRPGPPDG